MIDDRYMLKSNQPSNFFLMGNQKSNKIQTGYPSLQNLVKSLDSIAHFDILHVKETKISASIY